MKKHLVLIHGRNFKPAQQALEHLWFEAISHGLARDNFNDALGVYNNDVTKTFVYYGDFSNQFLSANGTSYNQIEDLADRASCLNRLKEYRREDFLGEKGKSNYENFNGVSSLKEWLADTFGGILETIGVAEPLIRTFARDVEHYWNPDSEFGTNVRRRLTKPLQKALIEGDNIFLVSHSLGTMIAYDVLWKFSRYGEYQKLRDTGNKLTTLVTLGSPLGNETVKNNLKGCHASGARRYPSLIHTWKNFAAEDDYISHDETLKDDYRKMKRANLVDSINDCHPYNLAVRYGKANPHHGVGYLIHPQFIDVLENWLSSQDEPVMKHNT